MNVRIDSRLFEILKEQGVRITISQFKAAYAIRKQERDSDPSLIARKEAHAKAIDEFWADPKHQQLHDELFSNFPELPR